MMASVGDALTDMELPQKDSDYTPFVWAAQSLQAASLLIDLGLGIVGDALVALTLPVARKAA